MSSQPLSDPEREYNLISKLELRIASASTDEKLEDILSKFLPALLLKLSSLTERNRNLTIKICQYVNQRLKINSSIQLPVAALVKTFRENGNAFVRRFCLVFIEQGLPRLEADQAVETLPGVLQFATPSSESYDGTDQEMWAIGFDFLLEVLRKWKIPERNSKEESQITEQYSLSTTQTDLLVARLCDFFLYDPKEASSPQTMEQEFRAVMDKNYKRRSEIITPAANFVFTPLFTDSQRLVPAVILSVDVNASAAGLADVMFKQCTFDFELEETVDALFTLYKRSKPKLQTKILSLLTRSQASSSRTSEILSMVEAQLTNTNTGLEASKLRAALFSYLTWTVRIGGHHLAGGDISNRIQDLLKEYIEMQGWPAMQSEQLSAAEVELRSKAYESLGLLAALKLESHNSTRMIDLITWLFTSLRCDTTRDIRSSIEEALGRLMNALPSSTIGTEPTSIRLKDLLLWNILAQPGQEDPLYFLPTVNSTIYPAVRFANKCLPFSDADARFSNVLASALPDSRKEVAEEAVRGLDPYWHAANMRLSSVTESKRLKLPDFTALVPRFFDGGNKPSQLYEYPSGWSAAVTFCRNVLVCKALRDTKFVPEESTDWKASIDALVNNDQDARQQIREYLRTKVGDDVLLPFVHALLEAVAKASSDCLDLAVEVLSLAPQSILKPMQYAGIEATSKVTTNSGSQLRAARIYGILCSFSNNPEPLITSEFTKVGQWKTTVGEESVKVQSHLLRACFCLTRAILRFPSNPVGESLLPDIVRTVFDMVTTSSDRALKDTAYRCLRQLALCIPDAVTTDNTVLLDQIVSDAKKENEIAISAAGPILAIMHSKPADHAGANSFLDRLIGLHEVKRAEFQFALGESLAVACAGFKSSSTMTELDVDADLSQSAIDDGLVTTIFEKVVENAKTTKPALKKAAAIWLLCLVQYCGDLEVTKTRLRDCQAVFARLLNDRDDIVQETGSRGLSLVYERGDKNLRDDLVRDLVQSFTGTKAKMSGTVNEDTQLFEAGALPTENGQSVTTYKDIVSLATEMGDPSLVYRFMNLASNNAIWNSRAAFGKFGLGSVLADSTYLTENKKFYPKLFRYRFDPNPNVQRSMNEIWRALVKDSNAVINEHFDLIMEDLLQSVVSGKDWRAREASCAAISDLVQGRDVEKFEKHLDRIWAVAFKVLDDVKETVRLAAMKLCRTLTSMLIRNLEVGEGNTKRSATMLNHAMPFLLQQMDSGGAKEVQQYAIVTLLEVIKKAPPRALQRYAPTILETLILSLSSLEHEGINYLHLNADKYGLTAEKLDKMRVSSINASPVTEAIERCLESITLGVKNENDPDAMQGIETPAGVAPMEDAMRRLASAYRTAIGLPSKVGLSRVLTTLVVRHQAAFRPYADKFVQLTRKHILDRNATISIAFSTALGYLMRLASEKEVHATCNHAQKLYFQSEELSHRSVAGEIIQAISKAANDVFMNSASIFLPFAFIGRRDTDEEVRERFDVPWKENIGGSRSINLYLSEIVALIAANIGSPLWPIRHACCFVVAELVSSMEVHDKYTDSEAAVIWPVMQTAVDGKTWEGKDEIIKAYPKFVRRAQSLWPDAKLSLQMKKIAIREAKRTNPAYRPHAVEALGDFAVARKDLDMTLEVIPYLAELMDELTNEDAMDVDEKHGQASKQSEQKMSETTAGAVVSCMFKILSTYAPEEALSQATKIVEKAQTLRGNDLDLALYDSAKFFVVSGSKDHPMDASAGVVSQDRNPTSTTLSSSVDTSATHQRFPASAEKVDVPGVYPHERFQPLVMAVLACPLEPWRQPERSRRSRLDLALVLSKGTLQDPAALAAILDPWLLEERSRPLRDDLERALQACKRQR